MKKLLAMILVLATVLSLAGCGGDSSAISTPNEDSVNLTVSGSEVTEPPTEEVIEDTIEVSGLIILTTKRSVPTMTFSIRCLDPVTGELSEVSTFSATNQNGAELGYEDIFSITKASFTKDYSKLSCTEVVMATGERHAGWIEANGQFYDVTEALGLQSKNEFDEVVCYRGLGFTEDEQFVFWNEVDGISHYYYVPIDDLSPENIVEREAFPKTVTIKNINYTYSDQIDENRYLVNRKSASNGSDTVIVDISNQSISAYIPGERVNWNGVLRPDKTMIAFTSQQTRMTTGSVAIYTIPITGGTPTKVETDALQMANVIDAERGYSQDRNYNALDCNILIGWE